MSFFNVAYDKKNTHDALRRLLSNRVATDRYMVVMLTLFLVDVYLKKHFNMSN